MLSDGVIEVNYLILVIALIAILSGLLIVLHFSRQKYENQLQSLQDEALLKLRALNERIEFNHSSYEGQINNLNTTNRKLEEEKKLIKENFEDKLKLMEKHSAQIMDNTVNTYELKLSNLSKFSENKEQQLLREFQIKELNFNEFGSYSNRKQQSELEAISKQIKSGDMPLSSYTLLHHDAIFNEAQKQEIITLINSINENNSLSEN